MENETNKTSEEVVEATSTEEEVTEPTAQDDTSSTSSSEVEKWKALSRKNETELRAAQAALDSLKQEQETWTKERETLTAAQSELATLKRESTISKVLQENGLKEEAKGFLTGETLEDLQAQAASLKALANTDSAVKKSVKFEGAGVTPDITLTGKAKAEQELAMWLAERR